MLVQFGELDKPPLCGEGECFEYSDTSIVLVALALERVTGKALAQLYQEIIYQPLKMTSTFLHFHEPQPATHRVILHRYEGPDSLLPLHDWYNDIRLSADWAAGGLVSTTDDMQKFLLGLKAC